MWARGSLTACPVKKKCHKGFPPPLWKRSYWSFPSLTRLLVTFVGNRLTYKMKYHNRVPPQSSFWSQWQNYLMLWRTVQQHVLWNVTCEWFLPTTCILMAVFVCYCFIWWQQTTVFQLYHGSNMMNEMRTRKSKPTLLPTQWIFNLAHHTGIVWKELAFGDDVSYTQ